jgi:hypothetical protein
MNIIPFIAPDPKCSFCGTPKSACKHFFESGNGKYICGHCVAHAKQRLQSVQNEEQK